MWFLSGTQSGDISIYTLKVIAIYAKFKAVPNPFEGLSSGSSLPHLQ